MKHLLVLVGLVGLTTFCNAQEIGARFGNNIGGNAAVDFVMGGGKAGRIHGDLSFGKGVALELLWDMLYKPLGGKGLNMYAGVGPYAYFHDPFYLGVSGELGLEYRFTGAPFAMGADWRPSFSIIQTTNMNWDRGGFNVRYIF